MSRTLPPPILTLFYASFRIVNIKILSLVSIRIKSILNNNNRRSRLILVILV